MNEFILSIDPNKFRSTNSTWNNLMLNNPWSVGYVTTLIELVEFQSKEEWESFYYESGKKRNQILEKLPLDKQALIKNFQLIRTNPNVVSSLSWGDKNINTQYGRTQSDIVERGAVLYNGVKNNGYGLTLEECIECVRFRVICDTWNGVIFREANTIKNLRSIFPLFEFRKTPGEVDYTYAVDYEVFQGGRQLFGLQIKPKSYTWNAPYILNARRANSVKNRTYTNLKGVPVFNVISKSNGEIENIEVLDQIRKVCI